MARLHYVDNIRAVLMTAGVVLHASQIVDVFPANAIAYTSDIFRMNLFVLISGYFTAAALLKRNMWQLLQNRTIRFGVPILTALILLNPISNYFEYMTRVSPVSLVSFLSPTFTLSEDLQNKLNWQLHIWFLICVTLYCFLLPIFLWLGRRPPLIRQLRKLSQSDASKIGNIAIFTISGAILTLIALITYALLLAPHLQSFELKCLLSHSFRHAPYFLFGILLFQFPELMAFLRLTKRGTLIIFTIAALLISPAYPSVQEYLGLSITPLLFIPLRSASSFLICIGFLSLFYHFGNWTNRSTRFLADASYTVYVVHYVGLKVTQYILLTNGASDWQTYLGSIVLTYAFCLIVHKTLVQGTTLGALLLNGKIQPRKEIFAVDPRSS